MYSLLFLGLASLLLSLLITPAVRNIFLRLGVVDKPDSERKLHSRPIVRVGGIAIALSYTLAFALLLLAKLKAGAIIWAALPIIWKLFPAAVLVFAIGLLDDLVTLGPWKKLAAEIAAASLAYLGGIHVSALNGRHFADWWSFPITVLWLLLATNSINLIDGLDGLATGVGLLATTTIGLAGLMQHNVELGLATVPLAASLLGFLRYNFNPATIFLGDCGSLLIGFLLGCYGVLWSEKSATILGMTMPLVAMAIPLLDTCLAVARRFLRRQPIFRGDRGHIHHRLLEHGLTPRRVALLLYGFCVVAGLFSLSMLNRQYEVPVLIVFFVAVCLGVRSLRLTEFDTIARMMREGAFRGMLNIELSLQNFERRLSQAKSSEECWTILSSVHREFGFTGLQMQLAGKFYATETKLGDNRTICFVQIPLSSDDYILFTRASNATVSQSAVLPMAEVLRRTLTAKLAETPRKPPASSEISEIDNGSKALSASAAAS